MELLFALTTALSLARPTLSAVALAVSAVLVFVAHESFMVLIGRRGARRREVQRPAAWRTMLTLAALAAVLLAVAARGASPLVLATLALPIALAAPAVVLALRGRERSMLAELLVLAALVSVSLPVALASGAPLFTAIEAAAIWIVTFATGTLAARGVLYRAKDRGRGLRLAIGVASIVATLCVASAVLGRLPLAHSLAPLPSACISMLVAMWPPSAKKMSRLGLGLTAASIACLALILL